MSVPWLIVAGDLTPLGGMDAANHALARHLARRGGDVHVVTHRAWPDIADAPSVTLHQVWRPFGKHLLGSALLAREGRRAWRDLQARGAAAHGVANGGNCRIDAANWVHYLHAAYASPTAGAAARRAKTRLAHRRDLADERGALCGARVVICNSRRTWQDVIERVGVPEHKVHVIYYGSDPVRFAQVDRAGRERAKTALGRPADRPLVGFVGALGDRRKAFDSVFRAWTALCARPQWDADLIVVGAGAELGVWKARAAAAGLDGRMSFLGFRPDVPDILAALDGFVHPARYEAYGLSVHEAICRGVPALVSARAGVAELYPDTLSDLLIADPDDPGEIEERFLNWRRGLERYRGLVAPLSASLLARTWDHMAREIVEKVERVA
jgi:glycosyltransferase involved in cell wall biosynthesis